MTTTEAYRIEQAAIGQALLTLAETGTRYGFPGFQVEMVGDMPVYTVEWIPPGYGWISGLENVSVWREDDGTITFET